jgi:acetolactate synthase-1/2/3 large subunit
MTSATAHEKYSSVLADWLVEMGYTHCFFVAGGGCMHLIDGFRNKFTCIPVVHEVTAGIAAEHFNEVSSGNRAFALVTTGPGLTNAVTAIAACFTEHRELLVIAGQVKSTDLKSSATRQLGVQEIDGVAICREIAVNAVRLTAPLVKHDFRQLVQSATRPHPGPVLIEICLDVQGAAVRRSELEQDTSACEPEDNTADSPEAHSFWEQLTASLHMRRRPVLLIGGLIKRSIIWPLLTQIEQLGLPVLTTTSAIDRIPSDCPVCYGRVGTWGGQRSANMILAQADCVVATGAQLDLQQTGFDVANFAPGGDLFQIFPCTGELSKKQPKLTAGLNAEPDAVFRRLLQCLSSAQTPEWLNYATNIRSMVPVLEPVNTAAHGYILSFEFFRNLSQATDADDLLALCSSGGTFTGALQMYAVKSGQFASTSAAFASMGYGLGTAIGMSFSRPGQRIILTEGDGGFSQNLQELAMLRRYNLPIKIFLMCNEGYASIRATQRKFFNGAYVGCDTATGLGFPNWHRLFDAYDIPCRSLTPAECCTDSLKELLSETPGPQAWIVPVDPDQTNWPAVASRLLPDGRLVSGPISEMLPKLDDKTMLACGKYLKP